MNSADRPRYQLVAMATYLRLRLRCQLVAIATYLRCATVHQASVPASLRYQLVALATYLPKGHLTKPWFRLRLRYQLIARATYLRCATVALTGNTGWAIYLTNGPTSYRANSPGCMASMRVTTAAKFFRIVAQSLVDNSSMAILRSDKFCW